MVRIGSRMPASAATRDELPATAWRTRPAATRPRLVCDRGDAAAFDLDAGDLGLLVNLDAAPRRAHGVAPGDRIVAGDGAGLVIERAENRIADVVRQIELGTELRDLVGKDQLGADAEMLVDLGPPAHGADRGVGMGERQVAALGIHDVDAEVVRRGRGRA